MPLDYVRYLQELNTAGALVKASMIDLRVPLLGDQGGFNVPFFLIDEERYPPQYPQYASGKVFFERVLDEVEKALALLESLTEEILNGSDVTAQRTFDEVSLRQRKLFETMLVTVMFSRDAIYAPIGVPQSCLEPRIVLPGLSFVPRTSLFAISK